MIVKKLSMVSGGGFPGAGYNERKVAEGVARLMAMENIDAAMRHKVELLHEAGFDCAGEIEKYLKERSRTYGNTKTTRFQFHIAASVKGQVMSADELTDFARQLMTEAGYGRQPYFVYYHHDTDNNHVHILSMRIQPNGFPAQGKSAEHLPRPILYGGPKIRHDGIISIRLFDGSEHTRKMSPRQSAWYFNSPESEREDVALRIAATMFATEIFEAVLQKYPVSDINSRIESASIINMCDGYRAIRVASTDGFSATYPMTADELRCHARLQDNAANGYLRQLAILRITHEDATELTNRIKELTAKSTGSITLPLRQSNYTREQAKAFTSHQSTLLTRLMPPDTSSTQSVNREWELGKQSRYDHIDNQQSGTKLTM